MVEGLRRIRGKLGGAGRFAARGGDRGELMGAR
jgi:hypothetical protein